MRLFIGAGTPCPFVSVVIVNLNGLRFLDDCLGSLAGQTYPAGRWEVVLVDNGSTDGSAAHVRTRYPWVRVIETGRNLGFTGGNNVGIRHCVGEFVALLNNDTVVRPRWLEALVEAAGADERVGGVASKLLFKHEPGRINSAGLHLYRDGRGGDRGFREADEGQYEDEAEVFGACGAAVLLRRAMLEDVGLFDERFFLYYEDLDLAWRARLRGWRFRYAPRSVVYHVHCGTSGEASPLFTYFVERNRVFLALKNGPPQLAARALAVFAAKAALQWTAVLTRRERGDAARRKAANYLRAAAVLAWRLPGLLASRCWIRGLGRRTTDAELEKWIVEGPPRARGAERRVA